MAACCLLITCQVAVSFHVPSPSLRLPSTSSAQSIITGRQSSSLSVSNNEEIEVEDFEEYARCMSPREVSSEMYHEISCSHVVIPGPAINLNESLTCLFLTTSLSGTQIRPDQWMRWDSKTDGIQWHDLLTTHAQTIRRMPPDPTPLGAQTDPIRVESICRHRREAHVAESAPGTHQTY